MKFSVLAVLTLVPLACAAPALAQSSGQSGGSNSSFLTRELNRAPPSAILPAPGTVTSRPMGQPAAPATSAPAPTTTNPTAAGTLPAAAPPATRPAPNPQPPAARPAATPAPATATTSAPPPAAAVEPAAPPPPPPPTVLNAAAVAALPFRVDLPAGVQITTGRPGPNFNIWSIRKGDQPLVMIYAGPASQFPIYDGQQATVGGRTSIVVTEENRRLALEHLFQRATAPAEIHVWVASVEGADRVLAEQIAQTVDPK